MNMSDFIPPALLPIARRYLSRSNRFRGSYATWAEAATMSTGYDSDLILSSVVAATRSVVSGQASYEQDAVLFHQPARPYFALSALLRGARRENRLRVLDLGGSLGSVYRQCRRLIPGDVRWLVIEQENFAQTGRKLFETEELRFSSDISDAEPFSPAVVLCSSVLQYIDGWQDILSRLLRIPSVHSLIIDRTPMMLDSDNDLISSQIVGQGIYRASYPVRIFGQHSLESALGSGWQLMGESDGEDGRWLAPNARAFSYRGVIFDRTAS